MIPPDESVEKSYKHILTYTFLETSICSERPKWAALSLNSNLSTLRTLPEGIVPDLLPNLAGPPRDIFQEGAR